MSIESSIPVRTSNKIQEAIGRRLYPDPTAAVVELVSNSYDADASEVQVIVTPTKIVVHDTGYGMTASTLDNFFTVGKSTKPASSVGREPIGTFGIGKFAILSMADNFVVYTKTADGFRAKAMYSHADSLGAGEYLTDYRVPMITYDDETTYRADIIVDIGAELYSPDETGVSIVMHNLHRQYSDMVIKQKLSEILVPQADGAFNVYVNGELLKERYVHGLRYDLNINTEYGPVTGEIIVAAESIELGDQAGVQVQVQSRGIYRTHFGLTDYDPSARRLSGYAVANWLQSKISSSRTDIIDSPEKTAFDNAMIEALRSILDREAQKRSVESEEKRQKVLDKAVRGVTRVLNGLPEFDFPKRALPSMVPVSALDEILAGKDPSADIEAAGEMDASITAKRGTRAFSELLDFLRQIAPSLNVNPSDLPNEIRTVSEALQAIEKVLGVALQDLIEPEVLEKLLGAMKEEELEDEEKVEAALRIAANRLKDIVQKILQQQIQDLPTQDATLTDGVTLHTPIMNSLELSKINLMPIAPPLDSTMLDLKVNPMEDGFAPDAPQAQINNFVATSIEHLGENGPASMIAEGIGFNGIQIYINADYPTYQTIIKETPNMINYHICSLIFSEVILLQNFTPREAIDKQSELMRILINSDKNLFKI